MDRRIFLAQGSAAMLLAGCGGGGGSSPTPSPAPAPAPAPAPTPTPTPTPTPAPVPITVLSDSLGTAIVAPLALRTGRPTVDWSIGSQRSTQVANRGVGFTISIDGGQITTAANVVNSINGISLATEPNGDISHKVLAGAHDNPSIHGTTGAIKGTLMRSDVATDPTYRFIPDAGQTLPIVLPNGSQFTPDPPKGPLIYIAGRNNFFTFDGHPDFGLDRIVADARRVREAFPRVLTLAVTNGDFPNEYAPAGQHYLQIGAINQALATMAGNTFLDHVDIAERDGLAIAGLTADIQSGTDDFRDVISHQLRGDALHPNAVGGDVFAQIIAAKLNALGW